MSSLFLCAGEGTKNGRLLFGSEVVLLCVFRVIQLLVPELFVLLSRLFNLSDCQSNQENDPEHWSAHKYNGFILVHVAAVYQGDENRVNKTDNEVGRGDYQEHYCYC